MNEGIFLFRFLGLDIYAYGAILALAVLLGVIALRFSLRAAFAPHNRPSALSLSLWMLPLALLGARLVYCLVQVTYIAADLGWSFVWKLWYGGYSLVGALLGGALGAWLCAKRGGFDAQKLMGACVPSAALVLALARLGEFTTDQGLGDYVESLRFFPFAVINEYGEAFIPVFFYEALTALVIGIWAFGKLQKKDGSNVALLSLIWLSSSQVLWESLREDSFLRFGFVRFNQLCAVVALLGVLLAFLARSGRSARDKALRIAGFVVGALALVAIEFALDKSTIDTVVLYAVMTATLVLMSLLVVTSRKSKG